MRNPQNQLLLKTFVYTLFILNLSMLYYTNVRIFDAITVSFIWIFFCIKFISYQRIIIPDVIICYFAYFLWCGISFIWKVPFSIFSIKQYIILLLVGILQVITYNLLSNKKVNLIVMINSIILCCIIIEFSWILFYGLSYIMKSRVGNEFINTNVLGSIFSIGSLLSLYLRFKQCKRLYFIPFIFIFFGIVFTGSKGALIQFLLGTCIFIMLKNKSTNRKLFINICLVIIICIFVFLLIFHVQISYRIIGYRMESIINILLKKEKLHVGNNSNYLRVMMYKHGFKMFTERPLFGYGFDSFRYISPFETYSHSYFIENLSGVGLIGTILYYSRVFIFAKKINKKKYCDIDFAFLIAYLISFVVYDLYAVSYNEIIIHVVFIVVYCIEKSYKKIDIENN